MAERKSLSKKLRFEVFKRDSFMCQYCGRSAPDVILELDHIHPVSEGGTNDIINLITSCMDCNRGKSNRKLSDDAVIKKRKDQLDELQARREQIEMMVEWNKELAGLKETEYIYAVDFWNEFIGPCFSLNDYGVSKIREWVRKYGLKDILNAMRISRDSYLDNIEELSSDDCSKAFNKIVGILIVDKRKDDKPYLKDLYYIRGIMKNNFSYYDYRAMKYLEKAYKLGKSIDELKELTLNSKNWSNWKSTIESIIEEYEERVTNATVP